jgi:ABC-2 type transport system ATP-binding protein
MDKLSSQLGTGAVEIEVAAPPPADGIKAAASKINGVTSVEKDPRDPKLWVVRAKRDVRADLARALVEAGHPPYHLRRRGDELDEIYRRYFADYAGEASEDAA